MRRARTAGSRANAFSASLGEALQGFLKSSGLTGQMKHPRIHEVWKAIVGEEFAGHTAVSAFRRGTLEIAVDSSALLNDIQFHRAALLRDLRREVKQPFISKITFVLTAPRDEDEQSETT